MRVRIGTSGFAYKEWKGKFYPEDLPVAKMLRYYAERFDTVEINNTFYRTPTPRLLEDWAAEVPSDFAFVLKAPLRLTHLRKGPELAEPAKEFFRIASTLGARLGPILLQLPPYLTKDIPALRAFFGLVPRDARIAVEATATWHDDEVYSLLRDRDSALCIVDDAKKRTPFVATASWGYLRLRKTVYKKAELAKWAERIVAASWTEAWTFFKHEDEGTGPRLATAFNAAFSLRAK